MNNEAIQVGSLFVKKGDINEREFSLAPIWFEYYSPSELQDLVRLSGLSEDDLAERFDIFGGDFFYSSPEKLNIYEREFFLANVTFFVEEKKFNGYLHFSGGVITSASIFKNNDVIDFFSYDLLSDENLLSMEKALGMNGDNRNRLVSFRFESSVLGNGVFEVPCREESQGEG